MESIQPPQWVKPNAYCICEHGVQYSREELPNGRSEGQSNRKRGYPQTAKPGLPGYLLKELILVLGNGVFIIFDQQVLIITKDQ